MIDESSLKPGMVVEFEDSDEAVSFILTVGKANWIYTAYKDPRSSKYCVQLVRKVVPIE